MESAGALNTWLSLMTPTELAELAASYDWTAAHLDWSDHPRIATFLQALDALIVTEQRRRHDPLAPSSAAAQAASDAMTALSRTDLQILGRAYLRLARNRERDASEPVQRFHAAVSDLLAQTLAGRAS
jgi:hypothetical protein